MWPNKNKNQTKKTKPQTLSHCRLVKCSRKTNKCDVSMKFTADEV